MEEGQQAPGASELCQHLKSIVAECLGEVCGGGGHSTMEWNETMRQLASSTISLTCSKANSTPLKGKPWDIEVRTALSYFHRFKDATSSSFTAESDLGLVRTMDSPLALARLLLLCLEQSTRDLGYCLDIRCNDAGIICITTQHRFLALRKSGRLPCPHCCQWPKGDKGLWWHIQQSHAQNHSDAMATAVNTMTTNAIVVYDSDNVKLHASHQPAQREAKITQLHSSLPITDAVEIAQQGDVHAMKGLIRQGFDPSTSIDKKGASLLLWAAGSGRLDMAKLLIEMGCDPSFAQRGKRGFQGRTALHWAARNGHLELVQYLVQDCEVCLESTTVDGTTAFCWAAWQGHLNVMEYLFAHGCNVSSVNSFGCNAALWAAQGNGSPDMIHWLDSFGCSCLVLNDNHHGVLHKAAQRGKRSLCEWFFENKVKDLTTQVSILEMIRPDSDGCVPSDLAGMEGHETLAEYLAAQEKLILERYVTNAKPLIVPSWLETAAPMVADSVWEPFAGVKRMRFAAKQYIT
jgi:hypothetical protein